MIGWIDQTIVWFDICCALAPSPQPITSQNQTIVWFGHAPVPPHPLGLTPHTHWDGRIYLDITIFIYAGQQRAPAGAQEARQAGCSPSPAPATVTAISDASHLAILPVTATKAGPAPGCATFRGHSAMMMQPCQALLTRALQHGL